MATNRELTEEVESLKALLKESEKEKDDLRVLLRDAQAERDKTFDVRDWINHPQSIEDWLALFLIDNIDVPRLPMFFRWLAQRSNSQALVDEVMGLLGVRNKQIRQVSIMYANQAKALVRAYNAQEAGATDLAASQEALASHYRGEVNRALEEGHVVANIPDGVRRNN